MKVLIVDPCESVLHEKEKSIKAKYPDSETVTYMNPMLAVKYSANNKVDILYTRINMHMCNGYQVAELVGKFNKLVKVYFDEQ